MDCRTGEGLEKPNMIDSESMASDFLAQYSLRAKRFSKQELRKGRTPDFRVFKDGALAFYCEVKELTADVNEGLRSDPTFNNLTDDIHQAVKQFRAVNADGAVPNVLVTVNSRRECGFRDLLGVLTGYFFVGDGTADKIYSQYSEGRLKDDRLLVHLFLWLDRYKAHQFHFNLIDRRHLSKLCHYFDIDEHKIVVYR
jgi:hypothetical protein